MFLLCRVVSSLEVIVLQVSEVIQIRKPCLLSSSFSFFLLAELTHITGWLFHDNDVDSLSFFSLRIDFFSNPRHFNQAWLILWLTRMSAMLVSPVIFGALFLWFSALCASALMGVVKKWKVGNRVASSLLLYNHFFIYDIVLLSRGSVWEPWNGRANARATSHMLLWTLRPSALYFYAFPWDQLSVPPLIFKLHQWAKFPP